MFALAQGGQPPASSLAGNDPHNTAIVTAVVEFARRIGLSTTAEGIEDQRCAELLQNFGM